MTQEQLFKKDGTPELTFGVQPIAFDKDHGGVFRLHNVELKNTQNGAVLNIDEQGHGEIDWADGEGNNLHFNVEVGLIMLRDKEHEHGSPAALRENTLKNRAERGTSHEA